MTNANNEVNVQTQSQSNEVTVDNSRVTSNYEILKDSKGKYFRKGIYSHWSSVVPTTREEKINMLNLLDSDDIAQPFKNHIGAQIKVCDVIFNPYDKVDEDTGELEYGVLTYLITPEGIAYVSSSKSCYHTLQNVFKVFGEPHWNEEEAVTFQIVEKKGREHKYVDLKIIG